MEVEYITHNGVNYVHVRTRKENAGIMAIGDKKSILNGELKFTKVFTGSNGYLKYGEELQIRILTHKDNKDKVKTKVIRNQSPWNTTEICMPFSQIDEVIEALLFLRQVE